MKLLPISMLLAAQYCNHFAEAFAGKRHPFKRSSARHYREDAMLPIGGDDSSKGVEEDEPSILLSSPSLKEEVTPMKRPARSSSWKAIVERSQQQPPRNDFQSRMKRIVVQQKQQKRTSYRPSNIKNIVSLNDFAKVIEEGRRESKVVVVNFIATWCKVRRYLRCMYEYLYVWRLIDRSFSNIIHFSLPLLNISTYL